MNWHASRKSLAILLLAFAPILAATSHLPREQVRNLGIFAADRRSSVLGQDGCTPIPVGDRMLWTFGDTILGSWKGIPSAHATFEESATVRGMIANSLALTDMPTDDTIDDLKFCFYRVGGRVAPFITTLPGEDPARLRLWAIDGIEIGATVYVYYMIIRIVTDPPPGSLLPIRVMGTGIAEWTRGDSPPRCDPMPGFRRSSQIFYPGEPVFGDSVIRHGEYLYLTGHGPSSGGRVPAFVARVRPSDIARRAGYAFLGPGGTWSGDIRAAVPLFMDVMGELSLSYNEHMKQYVIIYCARNGTIRCVTFSDFGELLKKKPAAIYKPPPLPSVPSRTAMFYYSGKEIFYTSQAIYAIYINPAIYQPVLLQITYRALSESAPAGY